MSSIGGPIRELGNQIRMRVENLVVRPPGELGLRRATLAGAFLELVPRAYEKASSSRPGFFASELRERLAACLKKTHFEAHERRFLDVLDYDVDREQIRHELSVNLARLLESEVVTDCTRIGLELHVLGELHACAHYGSEYRATITVGHLLTYPELRDALTRCLRLVPEITDTFRSNLQFEITEEMRTRAA